MILRLKDVHAILTSAVERQVRSLGRAAAVVGGTVVAITLVPPVFGQVSPSLQAEIATFNAMPPAQQQALLDQLQQDLPPGQRDAILNQLSQGQNPSATGRIQEPVQGVSPPIPQASQQMVLQGLLQGLNEAPRLTAGDTLVVELTLPEEPNATRSQDEQQRLEEMQNRLADSNPYKLDSAGELYLPGVPAIQLSGLNVDQATTRIEAEPSLRAFDVALTLLPLEPLGANALNPFGYDFFLAQPSIFRPIEKLPVPADYTVGPGDYVTVQLFGNQNQEYSLPVDRDGRINFPQIGPITVAGLTVTDLRSTIDQRVNEQMIGVRASTTLGELRSIQVFVVGDVERPGTYTVGALSRITGALYASGGVKTIGSLRNVALIRDGATVTTLDLYDMLLRGDTRDDVRLQNGDAVFVPPVGASVAIGGQVRRPAIYEIKGEETVSELLQLAGGSTANANLSAIKLERIVPGRGRAVRDLDLEATTAASQEIRNGDFIRVQPNLDQLEDSVRLAGNVYRPGLYQWHSGMTLRDLLPTPELLKPMSDLHYVLIRRENEPNFDLEVVSADLEAIWERQPAVVDPELKPRDVVNVFNLDIGRQHIVEPLINELSAEAPTNQPLPTVRIGGQVRAAGLYPLEPGMRVADLLRAGGGLTSSAYTIEAELTRYRVVSGETRETELIDVDLAAVLRGSDQANVLLAPYDYLTVKEVPHWREQEAVRLVGEVRFPGQYPIRQGETLSSVLQRAGGLTELAFPQGSVFTREALKEREAEQLETLANRVQTDLASMALSDPDSRDAISTGQTLVSQLRNARPVGRLVIDLQGIVSGEAAKEIVLRDGDELFVPPITQEVMVLGEVQNPTSYLYTRGLDGDDYIDLSGGMTNRADKKRVYVVRANGAVVIDSGGRWFKRSRGTDIEPGDTVVVPLNTDHVRPLVAWTGITQILYNIAIAVSVIERL